LNELRCFFCEAILEIDQEDEDIDGDPNEEEEEEEEEGDTSGIKMQA
jgi:hypothetical protein